MAISKEQVKKDFIEALEHIDEGEKIVSVISEEDSELAITMEPEIRRGKKYYTFGMMGHVDDEDLSDIGYLMLSEGAYAKVLEELGGVEGFCDFATESFKKGMEEGMKEGVPAG